MQAKIFVKKLQADRKFKPMLGWGELENDTYKHLEEKYRDYKLNLSSKALPNAATLLLHQVCG